MSREALCRYGENIWDETGARPSICMVLFACFVGHFFLVCRGD
jgi:hypothetical protein